MNLYQSMGIRFYAVDYNPSFKLKLDEAGTYMPQVTLAGHPSLAGQRVKFTFSKLENGKETPLYTITKGIDTTAIEGPIKVELAEEPLALAAGEYVITLSGTKQEAVAGRPITYMTRAEFLRSWEAKLPKNQEEAQTQVYDFSALNTGAESRTQEAIDAVTYQDAVDAGSAPWKIYGSLRTKWEGHSEFFGEHEDAFYYTEENRGPKLVGRTGAIQIHIPADGVYAARLSASGSATVALMKLTENRAPGETVATAAVSAQAGDCAFNDGELLELTAGEYILYTNAPGTCIDSLTLQANRMDLEIEDTFWAGKPRETASGVVTIQDASGNDVDMTDGIAQIQVADASVATATAEIKDGKVYYTLSGVQTGYTTANIVVMSREGTGARATVWIFINGAARFGGENLVWDFRKINTGGAESGKLDYVPTINYANTTFGNALEINPAIYSEPWAALNVRGDDNGRFFYVLNGYQNMGMRAYKADYQPTFKFQVNEAGTYLPRLTLAGSWVNTLTGMKAGFAFSKMDVAGNLTELSRIERSINAGAIEGPIRIELSEEPLELEAGEYVLTIMGGADSWPGVSGVSAWLSRLELLRSWEEKLPVNQEAGRDLVYNLAALNNEEHRGYQDAIDAISYQDTIDAGSAPWRVYSSLATNWASDPNFYAESEPAFYYAQAGHGPALTGRSGAVQLHVPADGWYIPKFKAAAASGTSANGEAHLMRLSSNRSVGDTLTSLSFSAGAAGQEYAMNNAMPIKLAAGEYILYLRSASGADIYLEETTLDYIDIALDIDENGLASKLGETKSGEMTVYRNGREASLEGGTLLVSVADPSIAELEIAIRNGKIAYTMKGLKRGVTTAFLYALDTDGAGLIKTINLSVNPEGLVVGNDQYYNFRKLDGAEVSLQEVTDLAQTTAGDATEINPGSPYATDPWCFVSGEGRFVEYGDAMNGIFLGETSAKAVLRIRVNSAGAYQVVPEGTAQPNGGMVRVYLAPADAADPEAAEYLAGIVDSYAAARQSQQEFPLSIRDLEQGEYILTLALDGKNEQVAVEKTRFDIAALRLRAVDFHTKLSIVPESYPDTMAKGESAEIGIRVLKSDLTEASPVAAQVTATSSAADTVSCTIAANEDQTGYTLGITALQAGLLR